MNGTGEAFKTWFACKQCGTVHDDYVRSVNCCTWVAPGLSTIEKLEQALKSGICLKDTL
jgi:hypothetical protein